MCLLILLRDVDPRFPLLVVSNRDEQRARAAAPPGLFVGDRHRMLSPRDRRAGGTWMAINDVGMFAGLTNAPPRNATPQKVASSRGELPHLALDHSDAPAAIDAVEERCAREPFDPFQLIVADADRAIVLAHDGGRLQRTTVDSRVAVLTNEHRFGEFTLPDGLPFDLPPPGEPHDRSFEECMERCKGLLRDEGSLTGHRILKKGGEYGTVSSSIVVVPPGSRLREMQWWYAGGEPDVVTYKNYGNLAKRLTG